METPHRRLAAYAIVFIFAADGVLAENVSDADARAREFMAEHDMAPIEVQPGTRFQRDLDEDWLRWAERTIVELFSKRAARWPDQKTEAVEFVRQAMRFRRIKEHPDPAVTPASLQKRGVALLAAKVDDPLVVVLHAAMMGYTNDALLLLQGLTKNPAFAQYPACERLFIINDLWGTQRAFGMRLDSLATQRLEAVREIIEDPAIIGENDDEVLINMVDSVFEEHVLNSQPEKILELCELPGLSEWAYNYLHGRYEETLAWKFRGGGYASTVTDEGWVGFQAHLPKAREFFVKAWQLHPERPSAAARMVSVVTAGGGKGDDTVRLWFDRTIAAQFDYISVYRAIVSSIAPRWGGSVDTMKAFGLACVQTARHDTDVPMLVRYVMQMLTWEHNDWRPVYRDELLGRALMVAIDGQIANAARPWDLPQLHADQALDAWACRDWQRARKLLADVPSPFPPRTSQLAGVVFKSSENIIRGECAIHAAGKLSDWDKAEAAYSDKKLPEAKDAYAALVESMGEDAPPVLLSRAAAVTSEEVLETGAWLRLKVTPSLEDWTVHSGQWEGTRKGHLLNRGEGGQAMIVYNPRVGADFEVRGEYKVKPQDIPDPGLGVLFGFAGATTRDWLMCLQYGSGKICAATLMCQFYQSSAPIVRLGKPVPKWSFFLRCRDGRIDYTVNGKEILKDHVPHPEGKPAIPLTILPDSSIGFGHSFFPSGNITRLLQAEVRRVK